MVDKEFEYEVIVSTSGRLYAGTDAKVFIKITGTEGESDEEKLEDKSKGNRMFESGSNDKFKIKLQNDVGVIYKIRIRHDDSGYYSGWHLNKVKIVDNVRGREYSFLCNRWLAKDEGDKKIEVELENEGMTVVQVDEMHAKNRTLHHTNKFSADKFLIRRGQKFFINIELAEAYDAKKDMFHIMLKTGERAREFNKTMVYVGNVDEFDAMNQKWAFKIVKVEGNILGLEVNCPADTIAAKYSFTLENDDGVIYKHPNALYVLFNPWCKVDDVYMEDEEAKTEYVLRQHGAIFIGSSKHIYPRNWYFGQFENISLDCAFKLLETLKATGRGNPIEVSRCISSLVNSCDNRGVLVGNWSDDYEGGKAPTYWTSSPPIFEEYMKSNSSVKYGQCWVFSALLTTVMRTLGIPCRSVTNFNSAHDTDANAGNDIYLDEEGKKIEGKSADSIWNFHCWNDAWMARPDLQPGYGGWQAIDGTPQEKSEGLYQMGPFSLRAMKEGEIDLPYDGKFALAEVNSDIFYWQKDEKTNAWEVVNIHRTHVGKKISTKEVGSLTREDITSCYKFPENSVLERGSVRKALKKAANTSVKIMPKIIEMKVRPSNTAVEIGEDIEVIAYMKNLAEKSRKVKVILGGNIVKYNGVALQGLDTQKRTETIDAYEEKILKFNLKAEKYIEYSGNQSMVRFYATCKEYETGQICTASKLVEIRRPELKFCNLPNGMDFGKEQSFTIEFQNPVNADLTDCQLHLDGTLMKERYSMSCGNFQAKTAVKMQIKITPNTSKGLKSLLATFNSKQLAGLHSSVKIRVL